MSANTPSQWSIGQKVICVDDLFPLGVWEYCDSVPVAGHVYIIRDIQAGPRFTTGIRGVCFLLVEIRNPQNGLGFEPYFSHTRFVPWLESARDSQHGKCLQTLQL